MTSNLIVKLDVDTDLRVKLMATLSEINQTANKISTLCFNDRVFDRKLMIEKFYEQVKYDNPLCSQIILKEFTKVSVAYRKDKSTLKTFKITEPVLYDKNTISYFGDNIVSIWCIGGRKRVKFFCKTPQLLSNKKKGATLLFKNNNFFIIQNIEIENLSDLDLIFEGLF